MRNLGLLAALVAALFVQTSAHAAAAPRTVVVMVGGLGSTASSSASNFGPLVHALVPAFGVREFHYGGSPATYTAERSCQSIGASTAELADYVRGLRDRGEADHVILVGHSNGGVVALGVPAAAPDLVPVVRRVVTVDAPLGGINDFEYSLAPLAVSGPCPAVDELYGRYQTPGWSDYLAHLVTWEQSVGVDVAAIANPDDGALEAREQGIGGVAVNYTIDAQEAVSLGANHGAVLQLPAAVAQLAAIVAAP